MGCLPASAEALGLPGLGGTGAAGHPRAGRLRQAQDTSPCSSGSCVLGLGGGWEQVKLTPVPESPLGLYNIIYL